MTLHRRHGSKAEGRRLSRSATTDEMLSATTFPASGYPPAVDQVRCLANSLLCATVADDEEPDTSIGARPPRHDRACASLDCPARQTPPAPWCGSPTTAVIAMR